MKITPQAKIIRWQAVTAVSLLLLLIGCIPDGGVENDSAETPFPTATLHPVFSPGDEFGQRLRETRNAESTGEPAEKPSPTPFPSPTDQPPIAVQTPNPTPTPGENVAESIESVDGIEVPILLYHHISVPEAGPNATDIEYFVTPDELDTHLAYLDENGFTPIDLYALYDGILDPAELPDKPVVITFDDGYADLYENAFPILQNYGFIATFFVATDFVEEEREGFMTWNMVEEMAGAGMRFETHSRSHADLRGQTNDYLIWQVLESQEALTEHLGYTPRFIAYAFGQYDENVVQFLEQNDFYGGLTAQGDLTVGLENRFEWPRLFIPAETSTDELADILTNGQALSYQPEIVDGTTIASPISVTVSISTSQGVTTTQALLVYDEELNSDWTIKTSPDVLIDLKNNDNPYIGDNALSYTPNEDLGSFFLQVRPNAETTYLTDNIAGVAFWLYTGDEPLAPDDLSVVVTGSNDFSYWTSIDESIDPDEFESTFEDDRYLLDFNRVVEPSTWVQVIIFLDDLAYGTSYRYITGLNFVNNVDVTRTFLVDELLFILREP